jgi:hypothetical protein
MRGDILTDTIASSFLGKKGVAEKFKGSVLKNSAVNRSIKLQKVFGKHRCFSRSLAREARLQQY